MFTVQEKGEIEEGRKENTTTSRRIWHYLPFARRLATFYHTTTITDGFTILDLLPSKSNTYLLDSQRACFQPEIHTFLCDCEGSLVIIFPRAKMKVRSSLGV